MIETVAQWRELLGEFVRLCFVNGVYVHNSERDGSVNARLDEICELTKQFEQTHPHYYIYCVKECYLGQGVDFVPFEMWGDTTDPEQAYRDLKALNEDAFAGPDCFAMGVDPR